MSPVPHRTLDRIGSVAGVAAVALLIVTATSGEMPAPDQPMAGIASGVHDRTSGLLTGVYTGMLMTLCLLVFGATVAAALHRAEGTGGGWWVLALVGIAGVSIWIVADAAAATFIRAVNHGVTGDTLWIGYGLDHWIGVLALAPLGIFIIATSIGARVTGLLARWTTWLGLVSGTLLIVGSGEITGDELTGGPLGLAMFPGYILATVWIISVSSRMWRRATTGTHAERGVATAPA